MDTTPLSKAVTIVIVTYNSESVIRECLNSIPLGISVVVVDNASSDQTVAVVEKNYSFVELIANTKNQGFGRGCNQGIAEAKTPFVFMMNPDTVLEENTLQELLLASERYPEAAILAPQLFYADGSIQTNYNASLFVRDNYSGKVVVPEGDCCFDFILGAAMWLRVGAFKNSGFFDPDIFLFYEDDDICLKSRKSGYSLIVVPTAKMVHLYGRSSGFSWRILWLKNYHIAWSRSYINRKYGQRQAIAELFVYGLKVLGYALCLRRQKVVRSLARLSGGLRFLLGGNSL